MMDELVVERINEIWLEFGGLRFSVYHTRDFGSTIRVFGRVGDEWREVVRFDDFVDVPHWHAPADDDRQMNLDVSEVGEPLEFYLHTLTERLPEILPKVGFGDAVGTLDQEQLRRHVPLIRAATDSVLPEGFSRVPGTSLQDADPVRAESRAKGLELFAEYLRERGLDESKASL
ncbi:hypothetical protein ABT124_45235 [Streptomyces sp. NPDC001982]|uniref:DUF7700 domain-containing protein n=1 Tax=Streptomyces sp. NPDC001982 TaxID=3154405 RepID=UPI0033296858